jgi:hypothetical protein
MYDHVDGPGAAAPLIPRPPPGLRRAQPVRRMPWIERKAGLGIDVDGVVARGSLAIVTAYFSVLSASKFHRLFGRDPIPKPKTSESAHQARISHPERRNQRARRGHGRVVRHNRPWISRRTRSGSFRLVGFTAQHLGSGFVATFAHHCRMLAFQLRTDAQSHGYGSVH